MEHTFRAARIAAVALASDGQPGASCIAAPACWTDVPCFHNGSVVLATSNNDELVSPTAVVAQPGGVNKKGASESIIYFVPLVQLPVYAKVLDAPAYVCVRVPFAQNSRAVHLPDHDVVATVEPPPQRPLRPVAQADTRPSRVYIPVTLLGFAPEESNGITMAAAPRASAGLVPLRVSHFSLRHGCPCRYSRGHRGNLELGSWAPRRRDRCVPPQDARL
jgi:hypothetical protein